MFASNLLISYIASNILYIRVQYLHHDMYFDLLFRYFRAILLPRRSVIHFSKIVTCLVAQNQAKLYILHVVVRLQRMPFRKADYFRARLCIRRLIFLGGRMFAI